MIFLSSITRSKGFKVTYFLADDNVLWPIKISSDDIMPSDEYSGLLSNLLLLLQVHVLFLQGSFHAQADKSFPIVSNHL